MSKLSPEEEAERLALPLSAMSPAEQIAELRRVHALFVAPCEAGVVEAGPLAGFEGCLKSGKALTPQRMGEIASTGILASWPVAVKRGRGRPAHLKPLPRLMKEGRGWLHTLVRLPANRAAVAAASRVKGEATAQRVRAAVAALGGKPTANAVLDCLNDADPMDLSTVRRAMRRAGIKGE